MKIVVFGATGIAGKAVVKEALKEGHEVTVLTRDAEKVTARHERLHVVTGNVMDRDVVRHVLEGQEAVIQTLGIGGKGDGRPTSFVSEANKIIMEEMERIHVKRLVAISVIGAGDSLTFLPWVYRKLAVVYEVVSGHHRRQEPHGTDDPGKRTRLDHRAVHYDQGKSGQRKGSCHVGRQGHLVRHHGSGHGGFHGQAACFNGISQAIAHDKQLIPRDTRYSSESFLPVTTRECRRDKQSRLKDVITCPADIHGYPCAGGAEVILMNTKLLEVIF